MWPRICVDDYRDVRFLEVPPLGDSALSLVLANTYPACSREAWVPYYAFNIHHKGAPIGQIILRLSHCPQILQYDGHIGYFITPAFRGRGYAAKACQLLRPVLQGHGFKKVVITCHPENTASRRTLETLGARLLGIFHFPHITPPEDTHKCRYLWRL